MPVHLFTITPKPSPPLKLKPGEEGTFSFVLTCLATPGNEYDVVLQALLMSKDGAGKEVDWLTVGPQRALHIAGGETQNVTITVRPTAASPSGASTIELAVLDRDQPSAGYDVSSPVICELDTGPPPPPGTRPRGLTGLAVLNFVCAGLVPIGLLILNANTYVNMRTRIAPFQWLSVLLVGLLVVSGVGYLLQKRVLGRFVGCGYAVLALITAWVGFVEVGFTELEGPVRVSILIGLVYPVLTLILLNTRFKKNLVK